MGTIISWLIGSLFGRIFMGAMGTALIMAGAWAYIKFNYVSKEKYRDAIEQIEILEDIGEAKEKALIEDDKQAHKDRQATAKTDKRIGEYEIEGPNYPDVFDDRDIKWLQERARD
jgi:hypothetical protein